MAARRITLSARDHYKLRLLAAHDRFYRSDPSLRSLARRGLVAMTGCLDGDGRTEWSLTDTGRMALGRVEGLAS